MRSPRVAWRPPPSTVYHRLHGAWWSPDGDTRYSPCGAVLDCPQYRSQEGLPREAHALNRQPCQRRKCRFTPKGKP